MKDRTQLTFVELCGIIANDLNHLAKLDTDFSTRVGTIANRIKQEQIDKDIERGNSKGATDEAPEGGI